MVTSTARFAFGAEMECLTVTPDDPGMNERAARRLITALASQAPAVTTHRGIFNAYGRCYCDVGHVEMATAECASPYVLPSIVYRLSVLAARAMAALSESGLRLVLANNNHSGLLVENCPVWGTHENYLVERHPEQFGTDILPFLVTRLYAGAGGVEYPSGRFLAGVRPTCLVLPMGGGTTESRAIHSTIRRSHHTGGGTRQYRYHLICGDGHRSEFNWAVQFGATALALKAIFFDAATRAAVREVSGEFRGNWVAAIKRLNVLANPGQEPRVDPLVTRVQRLYLDGARRYAEAVGDVPDWVPRLLEDWGRTLTAYEQMDRGWLAARFDTFAKYELFTAVLREGGGDWSSLASEPQRFHELALLNQNYHEFCNPDSVFGRIERSGLLAHQTGPRIGPGEEEEPFVPTTGTRADARARFIKEHAAAPQVYVDWEWARDEHNQRYRSLADVFATEYGEWEPYPDADQQEARRIPLSAGSALDVVLARYDRGDYATALQLLGRLEDYAGPFRGQSAPGHTVLRYRAWLYARLGHHGGTELLDRAYEGREITWLQVADYSNVLRFSGLRVDWDRVRPWLEVGQRMMAQVAPSAPWPVEAAIFQEHMGAVLLRHGLLDDVEELLHYPGSRRRYRSLPTRLKARQLALQAELLRRQGHPDRARRLLLAVRGVQDGAMYYGQLAYFTLPALAKCADTADEAEDWLQQAADIQINAMDDAGQVQTCLLQVRVRRDPHFAAAMKTRVEQAMRRLPALVTCPLARQILDRWDDWVRGAPHPDCADPYWNL